MSFFRINDGRKRDVYGQRSSRGSGTASDLRRYAHRQADVYRPHAPFVPVPSPVPRPDRAHQERQFFAFLISSGFWVRRRIALLPNPVGIDSGRITRRRRAHMGKHRQRDIEMVISKMAAPGQSPSRRKAAPRRRHLHRKASRSADRQSGISTALSITA